MIDGGLQPRSTVLAVLWNPETGVKFARVNEQHMGNGLYAVQNGHLKYGTKAIIVN